MFRTSLYYLIFFTIYNLGAASETKWHYGEQDEWQKQCLTGNHQSPVDLSEDNAEGVNFTPFRFRDYDDFYKVIVKNNGHTVEIRLNSSIRPSLSGGGLLSDYFLDSLHFHWQSEHTMDGNRYPLEVHLVHYDNRFRNLNEALSYNGVAVLGVLFYESPDEDTEFLPLTEAIKRLQKPNMMMQARLELDDFIPRDRAGYFRYNGSLTTPPCTETVIWTVFTNGLPISSSQLKIFSQLETEENKQIKTNYRALQNLNDRKIQLKISDINSAAGFIRPIQMRSIFVLFIALKFLI